MLVPYNRKNHSVYNPFQDFDDLERAFFSDRSLGELKTDNKDTGDSYTLEADLPGFKKDEVTAELNDGYITISAAKGLDKDEKDKKTGKYIRKERYAGSMSRSFYIGEGITQDEISAKYENGILQLKIPKKTDKAVAGKNYIAIEG